MFPLVFLKEAFLACQLAQTYPAFIPRTLMEGLMNTNHHPFVRQRLCLNNFMEFKINKFKRNGNTLEYYLKNDVETMLRYLKENYNQLLQLNTQLKTSTLAVNPHIPLQLCNTKKINKNIKSKWFETAGNLPGTQKMPKNNSVLCIVLCCLICS